MNILALLEYQLLGNPLREWTINGVVLIGTLTLLFIIRYLLRGRLQ